MPSSATRVYLEVGTRRFFASAAEWPGWCRSGRDEKLALEALAAYVPRYAPVVKIARIEFPARAGDAFDVVERVRGNATTEFGAPGGIAKEESRPLPAKEAERMCALLEACWTALDRSFAKAPASLRKGPRGGGRDRDKMFEHVLGAESTYAGGIGAKLKQPDFRNAREIQAFRKAFIEALRAAGKDSKWPPRFAARRTAWHALDHMWEMEDRSGG